MINAIRKLEGNPIKTSVISSVIGVLVVGYGLYRPAIIEDLSADFFTKAEAKELNQQITQRLDTVENELAENKGAVNDLATEVRVAAAFQMERGFKNDLHAHMLGESANPAWREAKRSLEDKIALSKQYRECLLDVHPNCEILQRQLLQ